jgi:hypothetical protein
VAFFLRKYGDIENRKEIHRLLNEYVLCETFKTLPDDPGDPSKTTQLWRDVNDYAKVGNPLMDAAHTLWWEGGE